MAPPPIPITAACPALTGASPGAWCRCHTCSQPARLEPSSRKSSCSPWIPAGHRRLLTRVGRSRSRGAPSQGSPSGTRGAHPGAQPVPAAGTARRTRRQGWQGSEGWHSRAVLSARAGGVSGGPVGSPRRQRGRVSVLSAAGRGEEPCTGPCLAPGESSRRGSPRTGIARRGGSPHTEIPLQRETPRTGNRPASPRSKSGSDLGPTAEPPPWPAPHSGNTAPRPHSPLARHSCKQRDRDQRGPARHPRSPFPFPRSHCPGAHEVGGNPRAGHGRAGGRRQQQQRGGGEESDGAHRAAHGRVP